MNLKEIVDVLRVVISTSLLVVSGYMAIISNVDGWGWFLFAGLFIYPTQINIDFKER